MIHHNLFQNINKQILKNKQIKMLSSSWPSVVSVVWDLIIIRFLVFFNLLKFTNFLNLNKIYTKIFMISN